MAYAVKLDVFEGPLDLLLHLIQKAQIDIYDIPVGTITDQYLSYLSQMSELDLEVASEFVSLAATLLSIKVRMLLPRPDAQGAEEQAGDPRVMLVQALLEYSSFKHAALDLRELEANMAGRYPRPGLSDEKELRYVDSGNLKATLYDLIKAMRSLLARAEPPPPVEIRLERFSFRSAFFRILKTLKRRKGERVKFVELFSGEIHRAEVVVVFLAVLELGRQGRLGIYQGSVFGDIVLFEADGREPLERPARTA